LLEPEAAHDASKANGTPREACTRRLPF
jgi:hypothetical protein